MNKMLIYFICLSVYQVCSSQEFSFVMHFEDAKGNRDSIEIGYDIDASEGMDSLFDEQNIREIKWDSIFDVRLTTESRPSDAIEIPDFHTKKQIIDKECTWHPQIIIAVDIKCRNWPVIASWNSSLFADTCNEGSVFTSIHPGGWWDTGSPSDLGRIEFRATSSVEFSPQWSDDELNSNYAYYDGNDHPISVFWIGLGKKDLAVSAADYELSDAIRIFPNPTPGPLTIETPSSFELHRVSLLDLSGQLLATSNSKVLDLDQYPPGMYVLSILDNKHQVINRRIVKL